ncbi:HEAT repeat domain-containing protein [Streptomyces cupreus]|uniref:HEAT repeat domain-containing protein n=1 Tax=Streptomyces cupreus TaxID=2759956 RepID=A0A7X1M8Z4_9ACTN|nr:HEAT repeat domain-containing protein [Streptomyces cupreus]MBC2902542.1 HEAT repeat domain-containing protein [Streptomyces cupreus]
MEIDGIPDVADLLRDMESDDVAVREAALGWLVSAAWRDDDFAAATGRAVPELARLARQLPGHRAELLELLGDLADRTDWSDGAEPTRRTVTAELPSLLPYAHDADPGTRHAVLSAVVACRHQDALPLLRARLTQEPDPVVRGHVVTALALLEPGEGDWRHALLTDPEPRVRLAAAEDLLRTAELPLPHDLVDIGARAYAADPHERQRGYWPSPYEPFTERLLEDPEAAVRALAGGVPLAFEIVGRWRDREADVLPWALGELESWELRELAQLACVLPAEQHARVRDHVRPYLAGDPHTRAAAVDALARAHAPEAIEEAVRLIHENSGPPPVPYEVFRAVVAVTETFGADALPVARAVARAMAHRPEEMSPYLTGVLTGYPEVAAEIVEELAALVPRLSSGYAGPAVEVLGRLGAAGGEVAERALLAATGIDHADLRTRAAVAHHRVSGDPGPALAVLRRELERDESSWSAGRAGELGPAARPLLPLIEPFLAADRIAAYRAEAALAVWRITGRTEDTVEPIARPLASTERFYPRELRAVETLTEIGLLPRFAVAPLRRAAESPRRVASDVMNTEGRHLDYTVRDALRELLATAEVIC